MSIVQAILVIIIAFFAGMDGILDEFEFYQPLVTCTLIGYHLLKDIATVFY